MQSVIYIHIQMDLLGSDMEKQWQPDKVTQHEEPQLFKQSGLTP